MGDSVKEHVDTDSSRNAVSCTKTLPSPYDGWDPMGDVSRECNNFVNFGSYNDPYGLYSGGIPGQTYPLLRGQIPCKFYKYDSKSKDCGRPWCKFLHARTKDAEPVILQEIILSSELRRKTKAEAGIFNVGVVVAITDPSDFCIVPFSDWICLCQLKYPGEELEECYGWELDHGPEYEKVPKAGVANLLRLFEDFRQFDRIRQLPNNISCVNTNQMVAVHLLTTGEKNRKEWYRAIVLDDEIRGESNTVQLYLIDYGVSVDADFDQLALLPRKLLRYPALGYRCSLNGVNPMSHGWTERAQHAFSDLVSGKVCLYQVVRPSYSEDGIFDMQPNVVELTVDLNGQYINLSKQLASQGMGIEWNPFPWIPDYWKVIPENERRSVALLMKHGCLGELNSTLPTVNNELRPSKEFLDWVFTGVEFSNGLTGKKPAVPGSVHNTSSCRSRIGSDGSPNPKSKTAPFQLLSGRAPISSIGSRAKFYDGRFKRDSVNPNFPFLSSSVNSTGPVWEFKPVINPNANDGFSGASLLKRLNNRNANPISPSETEITTANAQTGTDTPSLRGFVTGREFEADAKPGTLFSDDDISDNMNAGSSKSLLNAQDPTVNHILESQPAKYASPSAPVTASNNVQASRKKKTKWKPLQL